MREALRTAGTVFRVPQPTRALVEAHYRGLIARHPEIQADLDRWLAAGTPISQATKEHRESICQTCPDTHCAGCACTQIFRWLPTEGKRSPICGWAAG